MTRRYVEPLSVDALECLAKIAKEMDEPDYNIVDAHIEPDQVKIPSGKGLDPLAVIAARRREIQNLIDFEAFVWVKNEDINPAGKWISSRWEGGPGEERSSEAAGAKQVGVAGSCDL